jgi:xanthine/uracil permease
MVFGMSIITAGTCACSYLFLTNEPYLLDLTSPITPTIVVGIIACMISYQLMSVFSFSSDAILQSFLLDEELRFLGNSRPEFM